jgi:hypothetical protein
MHGAILEQEAKKKAYESLSFLGTRPLLKASALRFLSEEGFRRLDGVRSVICAGQGADSQNIRLAERNSNRKAAGAYTHSMGIYQTKESI